MLPLSQGSSIVLGYHIHPTLLSTSLKKSFFCTALYSEEVNLQSFVMIERNTIYRIFIRTNLFVYFKSKISIFPS